MWPTSRAYVMERLQGRAKRSLVTIAEESRVDDVAAAVNALTHLEHATGLPANLLQADDSITELLRPPSTGNPLKSLVWHQEFTELLGTLGFELSGSNEEEMLAAVQHGLLVRDYLRLWRAALN